jgi:hypothetical protein
VRAARHGLVALLLATREIEGQTNKLIKLMKRKKQTERQTKKQTNKNNTIPYPGLLFVIEAPPPGFGAKGDVAFVLTNGLVAVGSE